MNLSLFGRASLASAVLLGMASVGLATTGNTYDISREHKDDSQGAGSRVTSTFTSRATFNAALTGPITVEGLEDDATATLSLPATLNGSNVQVSLFTGNVKTYVTPDSVPGWGFVNTTAGGIKVLAFGDSVNGVDDQGAYTIQLKLPGLATGVGFDLSGYQGTDNGVGAYTITLLNGATVVDTFSSADTTSFNVHFRGYTNATPFNTFRMTIPALSLFGTSADFSALDEIAFNVVVPEPTSALSLAAIGAAAMLRRRRA